MRDLYPQLERSIVCEDRRSPARHECTLMAGFLRREKRTVYENPWLRFEAHDIVHPNGYPGEHGLIVVPTASAVVALDGADVLLARQRRFAIDKVVLEIVKGGASVGEGERACAERELREELGIVAAQWDALGIGYEIPSIMQTPVALFLARNLRFVGSNPEAVESIECVRLPFTQALEMAASGEIDDALTGLALLRTWRVLGQTHAPPR